MNNFVKSFIFFVFIITYIPNGFADSGAGTEEFKSFFNAAKATAKRIAYSINQSKILAWDSSYILWSVPYRNGCAYLIGPESEQVRLYASKIVQWRIDPCIEITKISIKFNDSSFTGSNIIPCHITFSDKNGSSLPFQVFINKPGATLPNPAMVSARALPEPQNIQQQFEAQPLNVPPPEISVHQEIPSGTETD